MSMYCTVLVPDCALAPFLSEDYTKVVKGWRPNVGSAVMGQRGVGKPSVYWMLNVVEVPVSPVPDRKDVGDKCGVDAEDFVCKQSEGTAMSQKAQRRMTRKKKVKVMWAGPAVVREQQTKRRVPIGHRGSGLRKVLFADSDEDGNDGNSNGSGSGSEGGRSRKESCAEIRAQQRSRIIRRDTAEVKRRATAKVVQRSLPEDRGVAVTLVAEMELEREEATFGRGSGVG